MLRPRRPRLYRLEGKTPVPVDMGDKLTPEDMIFVGENVGKRVCISYAGDVMISTVFLCLDHDHLRTGKPLLFETKIFIDDLSTDYESRCSTWEEAEAMHMEAVKVADAWIAGAKDMLKVRHPTEDDKSNHEC